MATKTKKPKTKSKSTEEQGLAPELDPYESMVRERLQALQADYDQYPNPEHLKEGETKLVPFLMTTIAELYVRMDIVMERMYLLPPTEETK